MTEEALCLGVDPEVGAAGLQLEMGLQTLGSRWRRSVMVACTSEGWRRTGEERREEGGALKLEKGANGGGGCRLTAGAGNCGAKCRRAWKDGCRWDSEEASRICFG